MVPCGSFLLLLELVITSSYSGQDIQHPHPFRLCGFVEVTISQTDVRAT